VCRKKQDPRYISCGIVSDLNRAYEDVNKITTKKRRAEKKVRTALNGTKHREFKHI
jgi:hypothetical protein